MNSAHWIWNYQAFLSELEDNFGPHDPIGNAEKVLNELTMKKGAVTSVPTPWTFVGPPKPFCRYFT